jgi:hypothetical protein
MCIFQQELWNWLQKSSHSIGESLNLRQMALTLRHEPLPEQWNVSPKNRSFISRSKLLKQIEDHFSQKLHIDSLS